MNTEWMGRYRPLVAALVRHANIVQRGTSAKTVIVEGISLSVQEWQVFEYIIEHLNDDAHMNLISNRLGIAQSSFSKIVKELCAYGLVEKYQMTNNKKNIILRPSELGFAVYDEHATYLNEHLFADFFRQFEPFSDEEILRISRAIETLNNQMTDNSRPADVHLVRLRD